MNLPVQTDLFGNSSVISDIESKILNAYRDNRAVADSDRTLILAVWRLEGLAEALGEKLEAFSEWFQSMASSTETITRAGRKLRSAGVIKQSAEVAEARRQLAESHRQYWRHR